MKMRVLSYNIHKGFDTFGTRFTLHEIRESIRETNADIVLLQEVVGENLHYQNNVHHWPKESQFEFLADSVWPHYAYGKNAVYDQRHHGNAVLSRFPIIKYENLNISTNRFEQRGLLHCELDIPEMNHFHFHIFNVHLNLFEGGRRKQMRKIIARAESSVPEGAPFVIGGDFNDWAESISSHFTEHLGVYESHLKQNGQHPKTFPSVFPLMSLDRVYFRNLKVLDASILSDRAWSKLSDHLPLLVEFELVR